ncbi:hypothetical protein B296_00014034 [Ensete ventricosum]|uniref:Non-haem dioxygenase N-terminal domain-containing protein n=1 Tax=Ensete ventricosum TaxID=4639 RepID=A0A427A040_ENSVE|nr:hypothetical protein B296_00014034 [Ensete ventricosum]
MRNRVPSGQGKERERVKKEDNRGQLKGSGVRSVLPGFGSASPEIPMHTPSSTIPKPLTFFTTSSPFQLSLRLVSPTFIHHLLLLLLSCRLLCAVPLQIAPTCTPFSSFFFSMDSRPTSLLPSPANLDLDKGKSHCGNSVVVFDPSVLQKQPKIPEAFIWPRCERPHLPEELEVPVVDLEGFLEADAASTSRTAAAIRGACASHGFFQVINHRVDAAALHDALRVAEEFFELPLSTKLRARRRPGSAWGYVGAHADRFASMLPWKETLSFAYDYSGNRDGVVDYITSKLGEEFQPMGYHARYLTALVVVIIESCMTTCDRVETCMQEGAPKVLRGHEEAVAVDNGAAGDQPGGGKGLLQGVLRRRELHHEVQQLPAVPGAGADAGDGAAHRPYRPHHSASGPSGRAAGVRGRQMAVREPHRRCPGHQHRRHLHGT